VAVTDQMMELHLESVEVTLFFKDGNTITLGREVIVGDQVSLEARTDMQEHNTISGLSRGFVVRQIDKRLKMDIGIDEHDGRSVWP
jgi:hypothetical protein